MLLLMCPSIFSSIPLCFCDFDCARNHKWFSGVLIGTGMLYVRKNRIRKTLGTDGRAGIDGQESPQVRRNRHSPGWAIHNATLQALEFHEQIGAERKFARLRYLKQRWAERLSQLPVLLRGGRRGTESDGQADIRHHSFRSSWIPES